MATQFPTSGCIVEYLEDNAAQIAMVIGESSGKLRLLLPGRRESKLGANRLLPWLGPVYSADIGREEAARLLEAHRKKREEKVAGIQPLEVWDLAQGEIAQASAGWFAELFESSPDPDDIAAYGRALLGCKTHFRFQPPEFLVFDADTAQRRLEDKNRREERDALLGKGISFLKALWELASRKSPSAMATRETISPPPEISAKIEKILRERLVNPDTQEDDGLWQQISKGLPDVPHLPLQLLTAWGKLPPHYNFWLDRADFDAGDDWWKDQACVVDKLARTASLTDESPLLGWERDDTPFISIDGDSTVDIDDAFYLRESDDGWEIRMAFACPAMCWPFGSEFDRKIASRATSIYLPEGDLHMLPEVLGTKSYSLWAGQEKPALCCRIFLDGNGNPQVVEPYCARVSLAANLRYRQAQAILDDNIAPAGDNAAAPYADLLKNSLRWAKLREQKRIADGAVIMRRPDPHLLLSGTAEDTRVEIVPDENAQDAQRIVAELMILASSALADWAQDRSIPLIYRTQDVMIPKEYAGVWSNPAEQAQIMRSLIPSVLELDAKPHAALAVARYAPVTSPLRRYGDLINEAQILSFLQSGRPRWDKAELERLLGSLLPALEGASHIQKFRVRYWKLLYFRQQGDRRWWAGVITDENEHYVMVSLPDQGITARGKRDLFDDRATAGMRVSVRLGKVHPLYNEIAVVEASSEE